MYEDRRSGENPLKGSNKKERIATLSDYKSAVKKQYVFMKRINLHPILL